jgi:hypothetical protein
VSGPIREAGGSNQARRPSSARPFVKKRDQGLSDAQLGNHLLRLEGRVLPHRLRGGFHGFLIPWCEGAQRMLHTIAELTEDRFRNVEGILRDEIHADTLRSDQPHDLLDFFHQSPAHREQRCLIEEERPRVSGSPISGSFS